MPASKLSIARARTFCRALRSATGGQPMLWRGILPIADQAGLANPTEAVAVAVDQGWIEIEGSHSVCLTEAGRRLQ